MPTPRLPAAAARRCVAPHPRGFESPPACPQESALGSYGLRALNFNGWAAETYGEHLHVRPALRLRRRRGVPAPRALGPALAKPSDRARP